MADQMIAGSINGSGSFYVTVSHVSKDSYLSKVIKLFNDAQRSKSKTQLFADTAAKWLTVNAIVSGIATVIALPLAAGILYKSGVLLSPPLVRKIFLIYKPVNYITLKLYCVTNF